MRLSGDRNQCQGCKTYFNSTAAFDKHRRGEHGVDRHCLTDEQMTAKGMAKNAAGFWVGSPMPDDRSFPVPMREDEEAYLAANYRGWSA
ncbi:MAG: hypothetical protein EOP24_26225 [Hyphomicrobiales bacterium]|nr:MAG: hypothetical protein EOP24_26225 [Hyphomicrobiales bacterium]